MYEEQHDRAIYNTAFDQAVVFATEGLGAERVMITFSGNGRLHNLNAEALWTTEPVSLTILRSLVEGGQSRLEADITRSGQFNPTSVTLSGIVSILFVPVRARTGEVCGFYYLDSRIRTRIFKDSDLLQAEAVVAGRIEPLLRETGACRLMTWELLQKTCWL